MEKLDVEVFTDNSDEIDIFAIQDYLEARKLEKAVFCSGIYFHGKLEKDLGYDLVYESDKKLFSTYLENIKPGEKKTVSLKANIKGSLTNVKAFLWRNEEAPLYKIRGLICYPNDSKAIKEAKNKQDLLSKFI